MAMAAHPYQQAAQKGLDPKNQGVDGGTTGAPRLANRISRVGYYAGGLVCVGLAIAGAALPLLPTTPFLLLAAFCFARSSPRLHAWLLNHRQFGPLIENWRRHGAIAPSAKRAALIVIALTPVLSIVLGVPLWALACQTAVLSASAFFIATRPDGPSHETTTEEKPQS